MSLYALNTVKKVDAEGPARSIMASKSSMSCCSRSRSSGAETMVDEIERSADRTE